MSAPELMTKDQADLIWDAITEQTKEQGRAAARELMLRSFPAAGSCTRAVTATIRRDGDTLCDRDGIPSHELATKCLAEALVDDQTGRSAMNDHWTLQQRETSTTSYDAAKRRQQQREAVCVALRALSPVVWRSVVDGLATGETITDTAA